MERIIIIKKIIKKKVTLRKVKIEMELRKIAVLTKIMTMMAIETRLKTALIILMERTSLIDTSRKIKIEMEPTKEIAVLTKVMTMMAIETRLKTVPIVLMERISLKNTSKKVGIKMEPRKIALLTKM